MKTLNTFGRYLRKRFGTTVYKISLNLSGFTCPNIDGKVARGGCTYCENESFSPNLGGDKERFFLDMESRENPLLEKQLQQIELQYKGSRDHFRREYGVGKYIAYFQSFSNTYAPLETLKALYEKALAYEDVVALSIGTRADCVSDELFAYLQTLSKQKEIWIEFGVQSIYDETLDKINRGEHYEQVRGAIIKAKSYGLKVCAHMIFGLPDESPEMMVEGTKEVAALGIDAIKFHPCYVVKNTMLANEFAQGKFTPIDEDTYLKTLVDAVKVLPDSVSIQRVTAGIANDTLIAPKWCGLNKNRQMRRVKAALREEGFIY